MAFVLIFSCSSDPAQYSQTFQLLLPSRAPAVTQAMTQSNGQDWISEFVQLLELHPNYIARREYRRFHRN